MKNSLNKRVLLMLNSIRKLSSTKKRVLVVDDDKVVQLFLRRTMEALGYEVVVANDGVEAVRCFDGHVQVMTVDYDMPKMNGVETTLAIRQKEAQSRYKKPVFIIGITSHHEKNIRDACFAAGMNQVLQKPIHPTVLENYLMS